MTILRCESCLLPQALRLLAFGILFSITSVSFGQEIVDKWRYTLRRPADRWQHPDFDDAGWRDGFGGFGSLGTPNARIGTIWSTNHIWLRKEFSLEEVPPNAALLLHHDEDAEVYINGTQVATFKGFITDYQVVTLDEQARSELRDGKNLLAVHCRQSGGGQFIDVHLIDSNRVPDLPKPERATKPFQSKLITKWGEEVTAENAWTEYPRPQMKRDKWHNLNGNWDYAITPIEQTDTPENWNGKILVPFCLESKLGGVERLLDASEALWYRREIELPNSGVSNLDERLLLHFEAVDYRCQVYLNEQLVASHTGGNTPFSCDISDAAQAGKNQLVVRVEDATEEWQLRGKQVLNARGIWYTQVSGIWQTVWIEQVPSGGIADLTLRTRLSEGEIEFDLELLESPRHDRVSVTVFDGDKIVQRASFKAADSSVEPVSTGVIRIPREMVKPWSPSSPHLYDIEVALYQSDQVIDQVQSYVGMRDVGKVQDADGNWRFTLNGEVIFHWGPLDQGWWPDGLLTPPSDEAMLFDIQWLKNAGFNMIRKHIKVEPRRYYYHCDRLGMMVWQDQVSGGEGRNRGWPAWTRLEPQPQDAEWPETEHQQFMYELEEMIDTLENHPSIVCWVPFNEAWGQHRTLEVGKWSEKRDPSRLINIASGGNFWPVGDIVDHHSYPHPVFPFELNVDGRFDEFIKVMGEFGGHGYPIPDHLWDADRRNWGYGGLPQSKPEYKRRYVTSLNMLDELRRKGIAGGVYTQTTDVEGEINGLMTYDRKVIKIPAEELAKLHKILFTRLDGASEATNDTASPDSETAENSTTP